MSQILNSHEEILACLQRAGRKLGENFIAPPCLGLMEARFSAYSPGQFLSCTFVFPKAFANPMGFVQGGFLMGAFDNVFGPLSILESGLPALTLELNASFLKPIEVTEDPVEIRATLVAKGRSFLVMEGEARTTQGHLAVRVYTRMFFMQGGK